MEDHLGGLKPQMGGRRGSDAQAAWDERQKRNGTKMDWVQDQSWSSEGRRIIGRQLWEMCRMYMCVPERDRGAYRQWATKRLS